jgi:hypothetical protein
MIAFRTFVFLAGVTLAILAGRAPYAQAQAGLANLPPDVMRFVGWRGSCLEWSKKATDHEKAAQIDSAVGVIRLLKCSDIVNDERALRERYASNPGVLAALDASWVKVVKRLPVRIAPTTLPSDLNH